MWQKLDDVGLGDRVLEKVCLADRVVVLPVGVHGVEMSIGECKYLLGNDGTCWDSGTT